MILDAVRESGGRAMAADEDALTGWMARASAAEGLAICPETAACLDVLHREIRSGAIAPDARIVVFNTGAAQKYLEAMEAAPRPDVPPLDADERACWEAIERR